MVILSNVTCSKLPAKFEPYHNLSANNSSSAGFHLSPIASSTSCTSEETEGHADHLPSPESCSLSTTSTSLLLKEAVALFTLGSHEIVIKKACESNHYQHEDRQCSGDNSSEDEEYICVCEEESSEEEDESSTSSNSSSSSSTIDERYCSEQTKTPDETITKSNIGSQTITMHRSPQKKQIHLVSKSEASKISVENSTVIDSQTDTSKKKSALTTLTIHPNVYLDAEINKLSEKSRDMLYTVCLTNCKYELVHRICKWYGLRLVPDATESTLIWSDNAITLDKLSRMKPFQKINHFPEMSEICSKVQLARNLNRMYLLFPHDYNIFPKTWTLPNDYKQLLAYAHCHELKNVTYIQKPKAGCQGKGIRLINNVEDVFPSDHGIYQVYISNPLLIDGLKFDMRVYTLVTSCNPLRIFIYNEGLARFTTQSYEEPNEDNMKNVFMHLTNYSLQRNSDNFIQDDEEQGTKRRLSTIYKWLMDNHYDAKMIWERIDDVIVKTVISCHSALKHSYKISVGDPLRPAACFELLGFDILLDSQLNPYILEVNHSPSFSAGSSLDKDIKESLIYDTLDIINWDQLAEARLEHIKILASASNAKIYGQSKCETKPMPNLFCRSRLAHMCAENVMKTEKHELNHLGNFRRVYPCRDDEITRYYSKFFVEQTYQLPTQSSKVKCRPKQYGDKKSQNNKSGTDCLSEISAISSWCPLSKGCKVCSKLETIMQTEMSSKESYKVEPDEATIMGNLSENRSQQSSRNDSVKRISECDATSVRSKSTTQEPLLPNLELRGFEKAKENQGDSLTVDASAFCSTSFDQSKVKDTDNNNTQNKSKPYRQSFQTKASETAKCNQNESFKIGIRPKLSEDFNSRNQSCNYEKNKCTTVNDGLQSYCAGDQIRQSDVLDKAKDEPLACSREVSDISPAPESPIAVAEKNETWLYSTYNSFTHSETKEQDASLNDTINQQAKTNSGKSQIDDVLKSAVKIAVETICVDEMFSNFPSTEDNNFSENANDLSCNYREPSTSLNPQEVRRISTEDVRITQTVAQIEQLKEQSSHTPLNTSKFYSIEEANASWQEYSHPDNITIVDGSVSSNPVPALRESLLPTNKSQIDSPPKTQSPQPVLKHSVCTQVENENTIAQLLKDVHWEEAPNEDVFKTPAHNSSLSERYLQPVMKTVSRATSVGSPIVFEHQETNPIVLQNKNLELLYQQYTPTSVISDENLPHQSIDVDTKSPIDPGYTFKTIRQIPDNFVVYSYPCETFDVEAKLRSNFICAPSHIALPLDTKELRRLKYVLMHRQDLLDQHQIREQIVRTLEQFNQKNNYNDVISKNDDSLLISDYNLRSKETSINKYEYHLYADKTEEQPSKLFRTIKKAGPLLKSTNSIPKNNFQPDKPPIGNSKKFVDYHCSRFASTKINRNPFKPTSTQSSQHSLSKKKPTIPPQINKPLPYCYKSGQLQQRNDDANCSAPTKKTLHQNSLASSNSGAARSHCNYISTLYTSSSNNCKSSTISRDNHLSLKESQNKPVFSKIKRISNSPGRQSVSSASLPSHLNLKPNSCQPTDKLANGDQVVRIGLQKKLKELKHRHRL